MRPIFFLLVFLLSLSASTAQNPWEEFSGAVLLSSDFADADSFPVRIVRDGKEEEHVVRLYFVDSPETTAGTDSDRKRVLEQMRYFGVPEPEDVISAGREASVFTAELLSKPFTLHTAFASAPGRSRKPRIYAMISTADGRDLAKELIRAGLARSKGVARAMPDGTSGAEYQTFLADMEAGAMLAREGIWKRSDAARIAEFRAKERAEANELRALFERGEGTPVDLNSATADELQMLPGLGPVLAGRIVEARPFASVEEITRVNGVSSGSLERWRPYLTVE